MTEHTPKPYEALLALAVDLLSQTEAQHRAARRLETATDVLGVALRQARAIEAPARTVHETLRALRELIETERALLAELERELGLAVGT